MTSKDRYFIGPGLRDKLRDMVRAHDSSAIGGGATRIPTRLQDMRRGGGGGGEVKLGQFAGAWPKGTEKIVTLTFPGNGAANTITAKNNILGIAGACDGQPRNAWVCKENGDWYLVNAEC